jgi:hypothetical protein
VAAAQAGRAGPDRRLAWCAAALFALSLPALARVALTIPAHAPLDHNEGWNAYLAERVASGRPLYPQPPRFFANNYPPLSFLAFSLIPARDRIAAGRAVSVAAFLAWVALLALTARRLGASPAEAAFGAALFFALMLALTSYVGIYDPQPAGHVSQALAMYLLADRRRPGARIAIAALLLAIGFFVKHSLVMLPLSLVAWLVQVDRRDGWRLLIAGATYAIAGAGACVWIFGPGFLPQLLMPRDYAVRDTIRMTLVWLIRMSAFLAMVVVLARRGARDHAARFAATYVVVSAVVGLALAGGAGVDWNMLFDANAACCLAAAVGLGRVAPHRRALATAACLALPVAAGLANARSDWLSPDYWLAPRSRETADTDRDVRMLSAHDGPALCVELALCWRAGKAEEVDVWSVEQRGARDPALVDDLARLVDERYYAVIQMGATPSRLGPRVDAALARQYVLDRRDARGSLLIRRDGPQPP